MKELLKRLIPEYLLHFARGIREARYRMRQTYSGVYRSFEEVPQKGGGYEDDTWPATAAQYSRWAIARNESAFIPAAVSNESALLPLLISVSGATRILDFGGATGFAYIATKFGSMHSVERYVVVEHPNVCARGRELFKGDPKIEFVESIPNEQFDIVLIGSALQYISDYKALLEKLTKQKPRWFLFTKLPAGENVSFVTAQINLSRKTLTSWLFNAKEMALTMELLGYKLIFRGGIDGKVNQGNIESRFQLTQFSNLLFEADSTAAVSKHGS